MVIRNYRDIREQTRNTLKNTPWAVNKTLLLFSGLTIGFGLLANILSILLENQQFIGGGLSGMATYRIFATAVSVVSVVITIANLFWSQGINYALLMVSRNDDPYPHGLFRGFKCWGALIRLTLILALGFFAIVWGAALASSVVMSPLFNAFLSAHPNAPIDDPFAFTEYMLAQPYSQSLPLLIPMMSIYGLIVLVATIFFTYRLRPIGLLILDEPETGALRAVITSFKMTRRNAFQLFRLDLSFWWYYLLVILCDSVGYLALLPYFTGMKMQIAIEVIRALLIFGVYMLGLAKIKTASAIAYDIMHTPTEEPQTKTIHYLSEDDYNG